MLKPSGHTPSILEVITDLSNDEVFTPPKVANAVLDLLPEHVWSNPTLRWIDVGTKTGVFLREITRRLMVGLADAYPDESGRLEHVLRNMVYGTAITELTALMSRRTVYCSKRADSANSVVAMPSSAGNVWFERVEHTYKNGRCAECGASEALMEREGRENHAYAFIHEGGRHAVEKELGMKFDVIVGNPPYQMTGGGGGSGHSPLYDLFVQQAKALDPRYISMVIPSRWMAGGRGLDTFRNEMLNDRRIKTLVDYPNSAELFPAVDIKSGICYFLWDAEHDGPCEMTVVRGQQQLGPVPRDLGEYDVLVRDPRALEILTKVLQFAEPSFEELVAGAVPFGLTSNFSEYRKGVSPADDEVQLYASGMGGQASGAIRRAAITKNTHLIDQWKVLMPKAGPGNSGGHVLPDVVLGRAFVAAPPSVCTETFLPAGPLVSEAAARSVEAYLRTRFVRFLVSLRKISQDAMRGVYHWVPQQNWDSDWTDAELYEKYGFTEAERAYIAEMVKEMVT